MCRWSIWCTLFGGSVTGWCNMITYRVFLIRKHTPTQCISFDCCLFRQPPRKKNIPKWWLRMSRFQQIYTLLTCKHTTLAVKRDPNTSQPPFVGGVKKVAKKTELCVQVSKMEALFQNCLNNLFLSGFDLWVPWWYSTNWSFDWIYNTFHGSPTIIIRRSTLQAK